MLTAGLLLLVLARDFRHEGMGRSQVELGGGGMNADDPHPQGLRQAQDRAGVAAD
jgi:hypothetical protein